MPTTRKPNANPTTTCVNPGCWSPIDATPLAPPDNQYCRFHLDEARREMLILTLREFAGDGATSRTPTQHTASALSNPTTEAGAAPAKSSTTVRLPVSPSHVEPKRTPPRQRPHKPVGATPPPESVPVNPPERFTLRKAQPLARRRAAAVLGAFGILATAGGWASTTAVAHHLVAGDYTGHDQQTNRRTSWAREADAMLNLTDKQLTLIALTETKWRQNPQASTVGDAPAPVNALLARKATLNQQRTQLQAQLAQYNTAAQLRTQLAQRDQHIADLTRQLNAIPANTTDRGQQLTSAALAQQLQTASQQLQTDQNQLDQLDAGLAKTISTPLPADNVNNTTSLVSAVLNVAQQTPPRTTMPATPPVNSRVDATNEVIDQTASPATDTTGGLLTQSVKAASQSQSLLSKPSNDDKSSKSNQSSSKSKSMDKPNSDDDDSDDNKPSSNSNGKPARGSSHHGNSHHKGSHSGSPHKKPTQK